MCCFVDESGQDDGAAKANPSLTREKDLVVNISDLDNIFDEDEEELGVRHPGWHIYIFVLFMTVFFHIFSFKDLVETLALLSL